MSDENAQPPDADPDEDLLRRYLLGEATAEEAEGVERHLFAEPGALARMETVEDDLLDAAARGELPPAEHQRVLDRLTSSRAGRDRLAFARDLVEVADGNSETQPGLLPIPSLTPPALRRRQRSEVGRRAAAIAAGVALLACAALLWLSLHGGGAKLPGASPRQTAAAPAELAPAIFELSLATARGGEALPTLRLAPGARRVELRIQLDMDEGYAAYRATLYGAAGRIVGSARGLKPRRTASGTEIALDLDAAELWPGRYEVTVLGERSGAEPELVGSRELAVT